MKRGGRRGNCWGRTARSTRPISICQFPSFGTTVHLEQMDRRTIGRVRHVGRPMRGNGIVTPIGDERYG